MFCTMFFGLTKLPQTSCSFSKTSRSAKTKFQHLETLSNKAKTKNHDEITRKTMQCRIASYKMYTMETKCPDRVQCPDSALMDEDFFLSEPVAFRRVYGLESYSPTSGESNHHRQSVSDTRVPRYQLSHEDAEHR